MTKKNNASSASIIRMTYKNDVKSVGILVMTNKNDASFAGIIVMKLYYGFVYRHHPVYELHVWVWTCTINIFTVVLYFVTL